TDVYTYYYKEGVYLRSYVNPKTYERTFESYRAREKIWQPLPNNMILSMNMAKYIITDIGKIANLE
ncbi:MAG TPA: hypothetical protein VMR37_00235, partial [Rhabdochlamydiaceae bacterium]|nr:hypothetical protein [Rhabdochlamydiaceae bacterium]